MRSAELISFLCPGGSAHLWQFPSIRRGARQPGVAQRGWRSPQLAPHPACTPCVLVRFSVTFSHPAGARAGWGWLLQTETRAANANSCLAAGCCESVCEKYSHIAGAVSGQQVRSSAAPSHRSPPHGSLRCSFTSYSLLNPPDYPNACCLQGALGQNCALLHFSFPPSWSCTPDALPLPRAGAVPAVAVLRCQPMAGCVGISWGEVGAGGCRGESSPSHLLCLPPGKEGFTGGTGTRVGISC